MLYSTGYASPLGLITLVSDGERLTGLKFVKHRHFESMTKDCVEGPPDLPIFIAGRAWLDAYFAGHRPAIATLPVAPAGSAFRQAVWAMLCDIPYGECTTYGAIAARLAVRSGKARMSAQAVGGAVGHNPLSIIIPCHRVVGASGSLTGYGGGIDTKIRLLTHEGVDMTALFVPRTGTAL